MNALGWLGKYLDGWAKFAVAIAALGWFGLQLADRYTPRNAKLTIGQPESDAKPVGEAVQQPVAPENQVKSETDHSAFGDLAREFTLTARGLATNTFAHLAVMLVVGLTGGLMARPRVNQWLDKRAVRAARRRSERHAADLRLLAANDAKGNVNGPGHGIQPIKRH